MKRSNRRVSYLALAACVLNALGAPGADAQEPRCRPRLDGPRIGVVSASDTGLRTGTRSLTDGCSDTGAELQLLPAVAFLTFQGAYPNDQHDGALWAGRGLSASIAGGIGITRGPLRIAIDPTVTWSQNRDFATARQTLRYPFEPIDWPQRPRVGAFATLVGGQSAIALSEGPAEVAISTENLWWGPARRYPILLGNSAPGFAHVRVGTGRPVNVGIGLLDVDLLWGRLDESPQFDTISGNDHRLLTGFFLELQPKPLPGLRLGVGALQHNDWADARSKWLNLYTFPFTDGEFSAGNGLLSITADWHLPASRADFYAEWARDDYWVDLDALLTEPDHMQAYLFGFEKLFGETIPWRFSWELVHLGSAADILTRGRNGVLSFYAHLPQTQGHTHRGQLLGAAIGPASNAQFLSIERLGSRTLGAYVERVRRDDAAYYVLVAPKYQYTGYDIELTAGLTGEERSGPWSIEWEGALSRRKDRGFRVMEVPEADNPYPWHFPTEYNFAFTARAVWAPGRPR